MNPEEMKHRTKRFGLECIQRTRTLPKCVTADVLTRQLIRSATSVGANYWAACRAKSRRDFIYKIAMVIEEANESMFWIEMVEEVRLLPGDKLGGIKSEANALVALLTASAKIAKQNLIHNQQSSILKWESRGRNR